MNRGSPDYVEVFIQDLLGFNEAPIHESGKYRPRRPEWSLASGFNEAPIHESGKYPRQCRGDHRRRASMRPRFMNRGSPGTHRRLAYVERLLQ